jgi:hypothetical protein
MTHLCLHKSAGIKKDGEQRELFMACLWVQELLFLVLLPGGKKSSELA